jgi:hypothetical protein
MQPDQWEQLRGKVASLASNVCCPQLAARLLLYEVSEPIQVSVLGLSFKGFANVTQLAVLRGPMTERCVVTECRSINETIFLAHRSNLL